MTEQEDGTPRLRFAGLSIESDVNDNENLSEGDKENLEQDDIQGEEIHKDIKETEDKECTETISDIALRSHESHNETLQHENTEHSDISLLKESDPVKKDRSDPSDTRSCIEGSQPRAYDNVCKNLTSEETCSSDDEVTSRDIDMSYTGKLLKRDELLSLCQALGGRSADQVTTVGMVS